MADTAQWAERVAGWKSSGLSSEVYCEGKPFTAGGLRSWAHRLRREARGRVGRPRAKTVTPVVRLGRVLRATSSAPPRAVVSLHPVATEALVLEVAAARILVRPGFDRLSLAAVLEVLAARASAS